MNALDDGYFSFVSINPIPVNRNIIIMLSLSVEIFFTGLKGLTELQLETLT